MHLLEVSVLLMLMAEFVMLLIMISRQMKWIKVVKELKAKSQAEHLQTQITGRSVPKPVAANPSPVSSQVGATPKPINPPRPAASQTTSARERVMAIVNSIREIDEKTLPATMKELKASFAKHSNGDWRRSLASTDYFRMMDLSAMPQARVVVIGDNHCDYHSISAVMRKLAVSDYDYFGKGHLVLLGDYLDRGAMLFEPLLLLMRLKEIMGDRLIMLRGNHELVSYDEAAHAFKSRVNPAQSTECLNVYCNKDADFLRQCARFFSTLPTYVYMKTGRRNVLLTHAGIARDKYIPLFRLDGQSGAIVFEAGVPTDQRLALRGKILDDMIWGDPRDCDEKIQPNVSRFEYGRKQFENFAMRNSTGLMLRSHEEERAGSRSFFDGRVVTVFSTGGKSNAHTGYNDVEPTFAILEDGQLRLESCFVYDTNDNGVRKVVNAFTGAQLAGSSIQDVPLNKEFCRPWKKVMEIVASFKAERDAFPSDSEVS